MIDALLKFASRDAAKADPIVRQHMDELQNLFASDRVIPDVKVWRASQDVAGTDAQGNPTVTHQYLAGYFVLVSLKQVVPALRDHPAVQLVINRDKANAREAGAVLKRVAAITPAILQDLRWEPVFAGFDPPWAMMRE